MNKLKAGLLATAGLAIGVVTLRRFRTQAESPEDEPVTTVEEALDETSMAADHAAAAASHARVAAQKAVQYAREELETTDSDSEHEDESTLTEPRRRLRKVGEGLAKR